MFSREQKIELQRRAWEMRLRGLTQQSIADELQVSVGYVNGLLKKAREEMVEQNRLDAGTATGEQVGRLDRMIIALTPAAEAGDVKAVSALLASWPGRIDDAAARRDWKWEPAFDLERMTTDFLNVLRVEESPPKP